MSNFSIRSSNTPYAFSPGSNQSPAPAGGAATPNATNATQDRLIVGVDFGTTYSGEDYTLRSFGFENCN
jgi:hypothetical protein